MQCSLLALPASQYGASLAVVTLAGDGHPFFLNTTDALDVGVGVGPLVTAAPQDSPFALNYAVTPVYNITLSVCIPQAIAAFSSVGAPVPMAACTASPHAAFAIVLIVTLSPIEKPPFFTIPSLSITTPGVASPGDVIGLPLSLYVTNPNTVVPWNTLSFSVSGGPCGAAAASQTADPSLPTLPFAVFPVNGTLSYTSVLAQTPLTSWRNPTTACVVATDGGGMTASLNVTVIYSAVAAQLTVYPASLSTTHYCLGTSSATVAVSLFVGTQSELTWGVGSDGGWLKGVRLSSSLLLVTIDSSSLNPPVPATPFVGQLSVFASGKTFQAC